MRLARVARALTFLVCFWMAAYASPVGAHYGDAVAFRPPSAAFGVAWGGLSLAAACAWALADDAASCMTTPPIFTDFAFCVLLASLVLFTVQAGRLQVALWSVAGALAAALALLATTPSWASRALVAPLAAWLIFALLMQATLIQDSPRSTSPG